MSVDSRPPWLRAAAPDPSARAFVPSRLTQHACPMALAGGRGSRLMQLTDWRAKPAVPFAGRLKVIDSALSNCIHSGIRRIGVLTQYKSQSLFRHIERGWSFLEASLGEFVDVVPASSASSRADTAAPPTRTVTTWTTWTTCAERAPKTR